VAWERRRHGRMYFYAGIRQGSRVRKVYLGAGEGGRRAAEAVQAARTVLAEAKQALAEKWRVVDDLATQLDQVGKAVDQLTVAHCLGAGWTRHNRSWRPKNARVRHHRRDT
jgi:hypothetical protein